MSKDVFTAADLRGLSKLVVDATLGVTDLVEQMHHTISRTPPPLGKPVEGPARGVAGLVYRCVRGVTRLTGDGADAALRLFEGRENAESSPGRDIALAALNGVVGDRLAATGNPLALAMRLRSNGQPLDLDRAALAGSLPQAAGRVLVLVHGLCMSDLQWRRKDHDHGASLKDDLGFTPLYLFYNSGLHVSQNGRAFADLLEALARAWPHPSGELVILCHSMGGLVARSACVHGERAGHAWRGRLRKLVFLGTPHHGAPLEHIGAWVDGALGAIPYTAAFNRLGRLRSAGVTDLRHGALLDEDWQGRDRFARYSDSRMIVPLPAGVACCAIAATTAKQSGGVHDRTVGDGLVTVASALGDHNDPARALAIPEARRRIVCEANHFDLLSSPETYETIRGWLAA
jgi:hypothetical protein